MIPICTRNNNLIPKTWWNHDLIPEPWRESNSSDEQEQDSDPYIGVAFGSTYWNKGGSGFYLDIYTTYDPEDVLIHPNIPKRA